MNGAGSMTLVNALSPTTRPRGQRRQRRAGAFARGAMGRPGLAGKPGPAGPAAAGGRRQCVRWRCLQRDRRALDAQQRILLLEHGQRRKRGCRRLGQHWGRRGRRQRQWRGRFGRRRNRRCRRRRRSGWPGEGGGLFNLGRVTLSGQPTDTTSNVAIGGAGGAGGSGDNGAGGLPGTGIINDVGGAGGGALGRRGGAGGPGGVAKGAASSTTPDASVISGNAILVFSNTAAGNHGGAGGNGGFGNARLRRDRRKYRDRWRTGGNGG